jgi:hypothetical protein
MQQLNRNTLDIPWDKLGLKPGDTLIFRDKRHGKWNNDAQVIYKVLGVFPWGMKVDRNKETFDIGSDELAEMEIRIAHAAAE